MSRAAVLWLALALSACASHTTYKTATPVGKNQTEIVVAPQIHGAGPTDRKGKAVLPEVALSVRHGLSNDVDLGGTLTALPLGDVITSVSGELAGKLRFWRSGSGRYELAVGGGTGYRYTTSSDARFEMIHVAVPLIAGVHLGENQLVVSPTVGWQRIYSSGARPVDLPFAGTSLGFQWRVHRAVSLLPEVSWSITPKGMSEQGPAALVHAGLGVVFH